MEPGRARGSHVSTAEPSLPSPWASRKPPAAPSLRRHPARALTGGVAVDTEAVATYGADSLHGQSRVLVPQSSLPRRREKGG